MREKLGEALFPFLERAGLTLADFDGFLLHPGGSKILVTAEELLQLPRERLRHSWEVLRKYGNMSSATALFVIKEAFGAGARGRYLLARLRAGLLRLLRRAGSLIQR